MGVMYRAETKTFASGAALTVNLGFLDPARKMSAPVVEKALIRINFSVTVGTAKTPQARLAEIFTKVLLKDAAGDRINLRGTSLYLVDQMELGIGYADGAELAVSGTRTGSLYLELPFTPRRCRRRNDYGLNLLEFLDGGELTLNCTSSTTLGGTNEISAIGATTFEIYFIVRDERRRELKARMCYLEYDITQTEQTFPVNGSVRWCGYFVGEVAWHGGTAHTLTENITSRTIDMNAIPNVVLIKAEQHEADPRVSDPLGLSATAVTITEDLTASNYFVPIVWPRQDQKIGDMVDATGFHFKTDGSVTTSNLPKFIVCVITDRQNQLSARTLGASSIQALASVMAKHGKVKTASYGTDPEGLKGWAANVVRRLPVTLTK